MSDLLDSDRQAIEVVCSLFLVASYELVRTLHARVEDAVGTLVKGKVEERIQEGEGQEKVAQIADEVINSKE